MSTKAAIPEKRSARERLLAAAEELFYGEGINTRRHRPHHRARGRSEGVAVRLFRQQGGADPLLPQRAPRIATEATHRGAEAIRDSAREAARRVRHSERSLQREELPRLPVRPRERGSEAGQRWQESCATSRAPGCDRCFSIWQRKPARTSAEVLADKLLLLYDGAAVSAQMDKSKASIANARDVAELLLEKHLKGIELSVPQNVLNDSLFRRCRQFELTRPRLFLERVLHDRQ